MVMNVATSAPVVGASVLNRSRRSGVCYVGLTHCVGADIDCRLDRRIRHVPAEFRAALHQSPHMLTKGLTGVRSILWGDRDETDILSESSHEINPK